MTFGRVQLEREPDLVALDEHPRRDRADEVTPPGLDREETLGDETCQRVVDGAAGDAQLRGQLVQAELLSGTVLAREDAAPQGRVDLFVEVRAREDHGHGADVT